MPEDENFLRHTCFSIRFLPQTNGRPMVAPTELHKKSSPIEENTRKRAEATVLASAVFAAAPIIKIKPLPAQSAGNPGCRGSSSALDRVAF